MGTYILRRLLLVIPTLIGVMLINFVLIQFVPGGPIEQIIAEIEEGANALDRVTGGSGDAGVSGSENTDYQGGRGLPEEFLKELEVEFGFDKPAHERFLLMMWNYLRFDFGESYFRSTSVVDLVLEKMPVSISLGLWATLVSYLVSIPLGIRKAVKDGTPFDTWTSGVLIAAYAIPNFLFAILLLVLFAGGSYWQVFPLRGLLSDGLDGSVCAPVLWNGWWYYLPTWNLNSGFDAVQCVSVIAPDYFWHLVLPVGAGLISAFTASSLLVKNSFLDEINKQYVITARAKGITERRVLYGHVFRNAMLIVIAGFPGAFISVFFGGSLFIEVIFSLDGLGRLGFEATIKRDFPVMFGTLYVFGLMGLIIGIISDLMYVWIDPRIDFENRET